MTPDDVEQYQNDFHVCGSHYWVKENGVWLVTDKCLIEDYELDDDSNIVEFHYLHCAQILMEDTDVFGKICIQLAYQTLAVPSSRDTTKRNAVSHHELVAQQIQVIWVVSAHYIHV